MECKARTSMPKFGSLSGEYYNIENKILNFPFGPVCANQIRPNYSVGSEQDEAEIQYDQWSTPEWCNCEKCEDINQLRMHMLLQNSDS